MKAGLLLQASTTVEFRDTLLHQLRGEKGNKKGTDSDTAHANNKTSHDIEALVDQMGIERGHIMLVSRCNDLLRKGLGLGLHTLRYRTDRDLASGVYTHYKAECAREIQDAIEDMNGIAFRGMDPDLNTAYNYP